MKLWFLQQPWCLLKVSCQLPCFGITWCQATSRHLTFWQVTLWTSDLADFLPLRSSDPLDSWPLWPLAFFPNWPYDSLPFVKLPFSQLTFWFLTFCPNSPVRLPTFCQFTFLDFWPFANLPAFYCWVLTSTGNLHAYFRGHSRQRLQFDAILDYWKPQSQSKVI